MDIREEQKAFDEQLVGLLKEHRGEFVIFKDGAPAGFFKSNPEAYAKALELFGLKSVFLIAQVEEEPPRSVSLAWDAGVMFG